MALGGLRLNIGDSQIALMESGHEELQTRSTALSSEVAALRDALAAHAAELAARDHETRCLVPTHFCSELRVSGGCWLLA